MARRFLSSESYIVPIALTLVLEGLIIGAFFIDWSTTPDTPQAKTTMLAKVYELNSKNDEKKIDNKLTGGIKLKEPPSVTKEDILDKKTTKNDKTIASIPPKLAVKPPSVLKVKEPPKPKEKPINNRKIVSNGTNKEVPSKPQGNTKKTKNSSEEEKHLSALADLLGSKNSPPPPLKPDRFDTKVVGSIDDLIKTLIQQNWVELGNPTPNTSVILTIDMLPDGQITNVTIYKNSGNQAFDSSAVAAAKSVVRVPEIQQLDIDTFNQLYRQRNFIFTAKDLSQ